MAPKPMAKPGGAAGRKSKKGGEGEGGEGEGDWIEGGADAPPAPTDPIGLRQHEVLTGLNYDSLPNPQSFSPVVFDLFTKNMNTLLAIFVHYAKASSECSNLETARTINLGECTRAMVAHPPPRAASGCARASSTATARPNP